MNTSLFAGLTEEQIEKVKACKTPEAILALAKEEGVELTGEQLEAVSGGSYCVTSGVVCPQCHQHDTVREGGSGLKYWCTKCLIQFN